MGIASLYVVSSDHFTKNTLKRLHHISKCDVVGGGFGDKILLKVPTSQQLVDAMSKEKPLLTTDISDVMLVARKQYDADYLLIDSDMRASPYDLPFNYAKKYGEDNERRTLWASVGFRLRLPKDVYHNIMDKTARANKVSRRAEIHTELRYELSRLIEDFGVVAGEARMRASSTFDRVADNFVTDVVWNHGNLDGDKSEHEIFVNAGMSVKISNKRWRHLLEHSVVASTEEMGKIMYELFSDRGELCGPCICCDLKYSWDFLPGLLEELDFEIEKLSAAICKASIEDKVWFLRDQLTNTELEALNEDSVAEILYNLKPYQLAACKEHFHVPSNL